MKKISRRDLFKCLIVAAGGLSLLQMSQVLAQLTLSGIVVHARNSNATSWDGINGWYGDAVNQNVVNTMVENGLKTLTEQTNWASVWDVLFTRVHAGGYQPGQKIAIKVNFNNSDCGDNDNTIDAIPQPVNALINGLIQAGVQQRDIWIYDATTGGRMIPDRFRTPIRARFPNVKFYGMADCTGVNQATFSTNSSLSVQFLVGNPGSPHAYLTDRQLPDLLGEATYLINMPILKKHGTSIPVTLGFKNHFGSLNQIVRGGHDNLHEYLNPDEANYSPDYSPLVSIYSNSNITGKTVLTVGDGLYGASGAGALAMNSWNTFGAAPPNSLFFATDPVAVDCVMCDILRAEWDEGWSRIENNAYDYLFCAQDAGLGTCEGYRSAPGGDPFGEGYSDLTYIVV